MEHFMEQIKEGSILDKLLNYEQKSGENFFAGPNGSYEDFWCAYLLDEHCLMSMAINNGNISFLEFESNVEANPLVLAMHPSRTCRPRLANNEVTYRLQIMDPDNKVVATGVDPYSLDPQALINSLFSNKSFGGIITETFLKNPNMPVQESYSFLPGGKLFVPSVILDDTSSELSSFLKDFTMLDFLSGNNSDDPVIKQVLKLTSVLGKDISTPTQLTIADVAIDYKSVPITVRDHEMSFGATDADLNYNKISLKQVKNNGKNCFQIQKEIVGVDLDSKDIVEVATAKEACLEFSRQCADAKRKEPFFYCPPVGGNGQDFLVQRVAYKKAEFFLRGGRTTRELDEKLWSPSLEEDSKKKKIEPKTQTPKPMQKTKKKDTGLSR